MDNPPRTPDAAVTSTQPRTPPSQDRPRQGVLAGRRVSAQPEHGQPLSVRESRAATGSVSLPSDHSSVRLRLAASTSATAGESEPLSPPPGQASARTPSPGPSRPGAAGALPAWMEAFLETTTPEPDVIKLPWLTEDLDEKRQALDRRAAEFQRRNDVAPELKQGLSAAIGIVSEVEQDTLKVDELLTGIHTRLLSSDEWNELRTTYNQQHRNLPHYRAELQAKLGPLTAAGALRPEDAKLLEESLQRLADNHEYLYTDEPPWADVCRRFETRLPGGHGRNAVVYSSVLPPTVFAAHLPQTANANAGTGEPRSTPCRQISDLELTTLANYGDSQLFSALRHGVIHAEDITPGRLAKLPDAELRSLAGELLIPRLDVTEEARSHAQLVDDHCREIRVSGPNAPANAEEMRREACKNMARQAITVTLVVDPEKLDPALDGETPKLNLFNIALLTQDDLSKYGDQQAAFEYFNQPIGQRTPVALRVRDQAGAPHTVIAEVQVRQFALPMGEERLKLEPGASAMQASAVERLLGPPESANLGGDVRAGVDAARARIATWRGELAALNREASQWAQEHAPTEMQRRTMDMLSSRAYGLNQAERRANALEEAGQQLKAMWAKERDWPSGIDAGSKAAARLALVGYLMGDETPVLSCVQGKGFTRAMDPEIKCLATVADNNDGHLPPVDQDAAEWGQARDAFANPSDKRPVAAAGR